MAESTPHMVKLFSKASCFFGILEKTGEGMTLKIEYLYYSQCISDWQGHNAPVREK
jgi:hypothetical protein